MPRGSQKIRQTRHQLGLSQLQLSIESGVSVRTIQFAESGKEELTTKSLNLIADALGISFEDAAYDDKSLLKDEFENLPWSMSRFIKRRITPSDNCVCHNEDDAKSVIEQMRLSWNVHLENTSSHAENDLFGKADQKLNEHYFAYEDRYLALWQRHPHTICLATTDDQRCGVSVVLPVTDNAYERLRDGEISFMDICADDIVDESQNLILDSAVEFAGTGDARWSRLTESLSFTMFYQIAMLSQNPTDDDFRMLSFGASPINLKRLASIGFSECGTLMPEFSFPICEFAKDRWNATDDTYTRNSTTVHYAHLLKRLFRLKEQPTIKRRVISRALRTYQHVLKPASKQVVVA